MKSKLSSVSTALLVTRQPFELRISVAYIQYYIRTRIHVYIYIRLYIWEIFARKSIENEVNVIYEIIAVHRIPQCWHGL